MPPDPPTVAVVCSSHAWTKHDLGIYAVNTRVGNVSSFHDIYVVVLVLAGKCT